MASKLYGIEPWKIARKPVWWLNRMLFYLNVEDEAAELKLSREK